ncbi:MAG: hypothetical protein LUF30_04845 [Lachnospiraceae bacterium]|nr:hypothetical protein [Lachnospiraceae bacterium]
MIINQRIESVNHFPKLFKNFRSVLPIAAQPFMAARELAGTALAVRAASTTDFVAFFPPLVLC